MKVQELKELLKNVPADSDIEVKVITKEIFNIHSFKYYVDTHKAYFTVEKR